MHDETHSKQPATENDERRQRNLVISAAAAMCLVLATISCFATSWATQWMAEWPPGSVPPSRHRHRAAAAADVEEQQQFSFLHASMQSAKCSSPASGFIIEDQIDALLAGGGGGGADASSASETKHLAKSIVARSDEIRQAIQTAEEKLGVVSKKSTKHSEQQRQQHERNSRQAWFAPPHAVRAARLERQNLLGGFYSKKNQQQQQQQQQQITSIAAVAATFTGVVQHSRELFEASRENITYARNTVDKLLYQLSNFEPLRHAIVTTDDDGQQQQQQQQQQKTSTTWNSIQGLVPDAERFATSCTASTTAKKKKTKKLIIGLSSVSRRKNYLFSTVTSLVGALSESELRDDVVIVILDGDVPAGKNADLGAIRSSFAPLFKAGALRIITRPEPHLTHPQLRGGVRELAHRWGDADDRVMWRSKQVLDVAFLMEWVSSRSYALSLGSAADIDRLRKTLNEQQQHEQEEVPRDDDIFLSGAFDERELCHLGGYFLMLEDDISASKHFSTKILNWVRSAILADTKWTVASFYNPWPVADKERLPPFKFFGVIGQLFRMHHLPTIVEFLQKNFDQSPLDWLFVDYLKKTDGEMVVHSPSYFQHEGVVSSLEGKVQDGRAVDFEM